MECRGLADELKKGESNQLQFLENNNNPKELFSIVSGLANTAGGKIVLGVRKNAKVIGVNPSEVIDQINAGVQIFIPLCSSYSLETCVIGHYFVVVMSVEKHGDKLGLRNDKGNIEYYLMDNGRCLQASKLHRLSWKGSIDKRIVEVDEHFVEGLMDAIRRNQAMSLSMIYNLGGNKSHIDLVLASLFKEGFIQLNFIKDRWMISKKDEG